MFLIKEQVDTRDYSCIVGFEVWVWRTGANWMGEGGGHVACGMGLMQGTYVGDGDGDGD